MLSQWLPCKATNINRQWVDLKRLVQSCFVLATSLSLYTSVFRHSFSILSHDPSLFSDRKHLCGLTHLCERSVFGRLLSWWLVRYLTVEGRLIGSAKVDHPQGSMWKTSLCQEPQPNLFRPVWRPSSKLWLSVLYLFSLSAHLCLSEVYGLSGCFSVSPDFLFLALTLIQCLFKEDSQDLKCPQTSCLSHTLWSETYFLRWRMWMLGQWWI